LLHATTNTDGLSNPLMRKIATKIAEECTSTDGFKAKLTQIKDFNQRAKPQKRKTPQTFEHARRNGKVGKKWTGHGISIKNVRKHTQPSRNMQ
jgi:hypothetical protein